MPNLRSSVSVAANSSVNVLAGKRIEFVPNTANAQLQFAETGSATGLETDIFVDDASAKERGVVSTQNRMPITPDDVVLSGLQVIAGTRISYNVYNTTAGALTFFFAVDCDLIA